MDDAGKTPIVPAHNEFENAASVHSGESEDELGLDMLSDRAGGGSGKPVGATEPHGLQVDAYANWDNGEPLTPDERAAILRMKSNYERSQTMNKRRNTRMLKELEMGNAIMDAFKDVPGNQKNGALLKPKPKTKSKTTATVVLRRSGRG